MLLRALRRAMVVAAATATLTIPLASCANHDQEQSNAAGGKHVTLLLNFAAGGYHAGLAAAAKEGFYKDAGLDVDIQQGNGSTTTAQLIASGKADIGLADSAAIMQMVNQGAPLKIVTTITQVGSSQVTALQKTEIKSVGDLRGHSIGVPQGSAQVPLVPLLLHANGLTDADVKLVNLPSASMVPSLLQGNVDTILGSTDYYGIQLTRQGAETDDYLFADNGVPIQGHSLFANDNWLNANGDTARAFVAATLKGWEFAMDNQDRSLDDLIAQFPDLKRDQAALELKVHLPLMCKNGARFVGKSEPDAWANSYRLLAEAQLLKPGQDPTAFYTYDYLPPEAQMRKCSQ